MKNNMNIRKISAYEMGRKVDVFVSERVTNTGCDDFRPHRGYWWCIVGGEVGTFVTKRPESGCRLTGIGERTKIEETEMDVFTSSSPIRTKEEFARLISE